MGDHLPATADPEGEALQVAAAAGGEGATMPQLLREAGRVAGRVGLGDGDRLLSALGLLAPTGAAVGLLAPFGSGAGVVLAAAFEPGRFWKRVADERVTVAALSPAQAGSVLAAGPPPEDLDRSRLRAVTCPAEPVDEALRAGFADRFGVPLLPDG
jgi:acyl-CoA synthetase (AMP-forming)/AMP-acid ligase II